MDAPFYYILSSKGGLYGDVSSKYKAFYPKFLYNYVYFISNNTSKLKLNKPFGIFIEGTRSKKPYIHYGYKYIALNNNAVIVYMILNHSKNKMELSEPIPNTLINNLTDEELLSPLKELIRDKTPKDYAINPDYCSDIKFR